jgi:hypothetical protein
LTCEPAASGSNLRLTTEYGYSESAGLLNQAYIRFGWGALKKGDDVYDVLSLRVGKEHFDIAASAMRAGANPFRDGAVSGALGGGLNRARRGGADA